jgi:uncharacterized protein
VEEEGSTLVDRLMARGEPIATATVAYAELYAGITRKHRQGQLASAPYALACRQIEEEWQAYVLVELQTDILILAREVIRRHALRGFDAIHLASALSVRMALNEETTFLAADERLLRSASSEGLKTLNVEKALNP